MLLSSTRAAEMTKLLENVYRAINIGLVNEMKGLADCLNIDLYEVINAASTKPFGFKPLLPGVGALYSNRSFIYLGRQKNWN